MEVEVLPTDTGPAMSDPRSDSGWSRLLPYVAALIALCFSLVTLIREVD
jgi:hypothetical protein